jgi:RNA polymerase sigma factor (sigma-70 family)
MLGNTAGSHPIEGSSIMRSEEARSNYGIDVVVAGALQGDQDSWNELVERYQPTINSVCRRHGLTRDDAADVSQTVWLRTIQWLGRLREPRALPGWIKTTARREAWNVIRSGTHVHPVKDEILATDPTAVGSGIRGAQADERILQEEERAALREGLAELSERDRVLLTMLVADPPISYRQISDQLGLPVGSIGPTRARCLRRLAETAAMRAITLETPDAARGAQAA